MRSRSLGLKWLAVALLASAGTAQEAWTRIELETPHYELVGWGTPAEVRGWGEVLEQTWAELERVLGARPKLAAGKRLDFRMYADEAARRDGLLADKQAVPTAAAPAWFSPYDEVLYAFRDKSVVYTRMMVVYGAVLQFHGLCKEKNLDLDATWYVHGLAQTMCVHAWDGKRAEFAYTPRLCMIDYPGRALAALGGKGFGVDPWNEERMRDPYVNWAAVRFALFGAGGKYESKFQKLALGHTGSKLSGADFLRSLGREKDVTREFHDWLVAAQYPLAIAQGEWDDRSDGRVSGGALDAREIGAAVLREPRTQLSVRLNELRRPGLTSYAVLAWQTPTIYVIAHAEAPFFVVEFVRDGKQVDQLKLPLPATAVDSAFVTLEKLESKAGAIKKQIAERPGAVRITIDEQDLGTVNVYEGPLGIAAQGGLAEFTELAFH